MSRLANTNYAISYATGTNRGLLTITTRAGHIKANDVTRDATGLDAGLQHRPDRRHASPSGERLGRLGTPTYGFDNVGDGTTVGSYRIDVSGWPTPTTRSPTHRHQPRRC